VPRREQVIASILLELGAVSISVSPPFTWASGLKAPLYCDNRLLLSTVTQRRSVCSAFRALLQEQAWQPAVIAGTATAGIPHAAWLAEALSLPMVYVRSAEKGHGKKNLIEGRLEPGAPCVLVEDLISTGGSVLKAAAGLREAGAELLGVAAVFQYGLPAASAHFAAANLAFASLTDLESLLAVAMSENRIQDGDRDIVREWRKDPAAWSRAHT